MDLKIFDVEHGACALLTCNNSARLMIDCGHNASTGWYPGTYLKGQGISQIEGLAITNYDEDHVSGIANLFTNVSVLSLYRNPSVSSETIHQLKSDTGVGQGILFLGERIKNTFTGGPADASVFQGLQIWWHYNQYPSFDDENNLSYVVFLKCFGVGVLFPGDVEGAGWRSLMATPQFITVLGDTSVLVASHHGRQNGWCDELRKYCNPYYVVVSDKGYMHDSQETVPLYRAIAKGGPFRSEPERRVLTTRSDGRIGFTFTGQSWNAY
jgi:beta-lactamase superfamily II metal-dependent hydrolase